jgi:5-methylcytosine-specific restriction endonuclease McrA
MSVRIINADVMEGLRQLPDESVHCVVTSRRNASGQFSKGSHWRTPKPHWQRQWLIDEYVIKARSTTEIAHEMGCTENNIQFWLKKHGIPARTVSQARSVKHWGACGAANAMHGRTGHLNPRYVDGSSPERQRLYAQSLGREFLKRIYARDGYACRKCGAPKTTPKSLHAHHIKPWAGNPALRFDDANAVTLCCPCHSWVHSKRNVGREWLA